MDLSIIIINYNTLKITSECIESIILKTSFVKYEIILIDNNSSEANPLLFKEKFPNITLIRNKKNVGFGVANNQGMKLAKGVFFLLLNSDTILINNAIDIAYDHAIKHPNYSIFGANILNEDLTPQRSYFSSNKINIKSALKQGFINSNPLLSKFLHFNNKANEVNGLYGSYIFLHRKVFEETGGFDPDFFMYCEDTEWFRNRIKNRFNISICKESKIVHYGSKSTKEVNMVNKQNVLSYFLYWYKLGRPHFYSYTFGVYINSFITIFLLPLMSKNERKRHSNLIKARLQIIFQVFGDIPRYGNNFAARPEFLKVKD